MEITDNTSLVEMLQTGRLGLLKLGLSLAEVKELLGEPTTIFESYPRPSDIWTYSFGCLDIIYFMGEMYSFGIYFQRIEEGLPVSLGYKICATSPSKN